MLRTAFKLIICAFAVIGLLVVMLMAGGIWFTSARLHKPPKPPEKILLVLDFRDELTEQDDAMEGLRSVFSLVRSERQGRMNLHDVVQALQRGSKDPRVVGAVGLFGPNLPHLSQTQEVRSALEKFRAGGKFTIAYSPSYGEFGPGNFAYYMAAAFEKVWLQPVGTVGISGMRMENPFIRPVLDKFGIKADFVQKEEYKTAMAFMTDEKMSPAMREEMQTLLDSLNNQVVAGIASGRGLKPEEARTLMQKGPYTAKEALERKLIDKIGYTDEIEKWIDDTHGKKTAKLRPSRYLSLPDYVEKGKPAPVIKPKATIALITAEGEISDNEGAPSPLSGGADTMNSRQIAQAFDDAIEDKDVKLIIFRVDSPGGSPTASETIRRAVVQAKAKGKKVIVSMGQMAGSGGYWIAMDADRIIANPATLTGSIGVLGGKFELSGLFAQYGVKWEAVDTGGQYPGLWSIASGYTSAERARLDALLNDTYVSFRENVSKARKIPMEKMDMVSKGRVFTGEQALKLGLVDELGGLRAAIDFAKTSLGLGADDRIAIRRLPQRSSPAERVRDLLRGFFDIGAHLPAIDHDTLLQWSRQAFPTRQTHMPMLRFE